MSLNITNQHIFARLFHKILIFNLYLLTLLNMKKDIHPKYYQATVKCSCGNTFTMGATKELIETETCSQCHPFYTGKEKSLSTMGRVQKFRERLSKKQASHKKIRVKKNGSK